MAVENNINVRSFKGDILSRKRLFYTPFDPGAYKHQAKVGFYEYRFRNVITSINQ